MAYHPSDHWPLVGDVRRWLRSRREAARVRTWREQGCPAPPPHSIKQLVLREYARRHGCKLLVETGTFMGDMVEAMRRDFDRVYSIELSEELYQKARRRFARCGNVELIQGDSGVELGKLLQKLDQKTLFWLDGHWSAGPTAKGDKETPIAEELDHVAPLLLQGHVVLIDDARLFGIDPDYPPIDVVEDYLRVETGDSVDMHIDNDIIRLTPRAAVSRLAA